MDVRTRFAPSPTGVLHLGSIRTALYCWLFARHHKGIFVLRIEDTDRERSTPENVQAILDGLAWFGLDADEGPYYQTDRYERYAEIRDQWLAEGKAYRCYCSRERLDALRAAQMEAGERVRYDGRCRDAAVPQSGIEPVVRFKTPRDGEIVVSDAVRGKVVFENAQLDDLIIARSDGSPTYNFTVVVDDSDMRISHVIRGDDHLNNTPRQIHMFSALGAEPPAFAHLPMILAPDGSKLSKRSGAVDIRDFRDQGYLKDALLNYLVRLGWSHGDREIFSVEELIRLFDIADINRSASSFNPEKLLWLNQQYILRESKERLGEALLPFLKEQGLDPASGPDPAEVAEGFRERAETLKAMATSASYCYRDFESIDPGSAKKHLRPVVLEPISAVRSALAETSSWSTTAIDAVVRDVAAKFDIGLGKIGQPLRVAVTGGPVSPPIDVTIYLVGRERTLNRLDSAIALIEKRAAASGG